MATGKGKRDETVVCMRPSEGWSAEPETVHRVQTIAEMIVSGKSRSSIQSFIRNEYGVKERQARAYYSAAMKYIQPDDEDEYRKGLIQANLERLEMIVERCMDGENYSSAISAIKEINSIISPKNNTVEVATSDTAFRITFGNE